MQFSPSVYEHAARLIDQMRKKACIGTGALPYETPPENVLKLKQYLAAR